MELLFKIAKIENLPQIVEIYNQSIPGRLATADLKSVTVEDRREWFLEHRNNRPIWIIMDKNRVIGWISLSDFYGREAYRSTAEVSIYLADTAHGKGVGTKALKFTEEKAPHLGINRLVAFIFAHNEASKHIFSKAGFELWGEMPEVANMDGQLRSLDIFGKKIVNLRK
ncbi:GNAT family N-acetyltransferase [Pediococcus claussenii]|uniref:Phosphinothricin acetyltransferase YwnH n=1 Tax=Pediococcus claussenii (strain ATCC BAA-344 / DSM 14800 / JCM 18046 / KCTC 3811 / LMG 21948 / P06) TaxID=701521 RepID=G8PES5_PEDCP|nr:GNAT family N-acetyltransferase [Pediococcus claussenii]AEV94455.1 putative phosphinothricin acetyltransferase YwnH [Pediococcus claussenii ATCC BAA-344]ANZ69675.1 acetyltransferase [Pediococcus claussenii]ANZ71492.1 acetyltransferase [Pediococcus claussenii]KRN19839.1 ywnH protein [Pediococcus claussenii]